MYLPGVLKIGWSLMIKPMDMIRGPTDGISPHIIIWPLSPPVEAYARYPCIMLTVHYIPSIVSFLIIYSNALHPRKIELTRTSTNATTNFCPCSWTYWDPQVPRPFPTRIHTSWQQEYHVIIFKLRSHYFWVWVQSARFCIRTDMNVQWNSWIDLRYEIESS